MNKRLIEFFTNEHIGYCPLTIMSNVQSVYKQDRDWTCSIACLRTIASHTAYLPEEYDILQRYKINKGPQSSHSIRDWMKDDERFRYGCVDTIPEDYKLTYLTDLMKTHNVMIECMLNYEHWVVILGYVYLGSDELAQFIVYDPYYNNVRVIIAEELVSMWYGVEDYPIHRDYVACRKDVSSNVFWEEDKTVNC